MNQTINVIIDSRIFQGQPGESILDVARRNQIEIPTLCHDPRLDPFSSCYLCVVEVKGMRGHQPACSTRISEGMEVTTQSEAIRKSRRTALELMLSNHFADCFGPCKQTCPAGVDVQGYISLIEKKMYSEAIALIKEANPLPAICGRVCVRPCEAACRRNLLGEGTGVGIDYLKRFAADVDLESDRAVKPVVKASTGKKVAVIGAGPGGLSAAWWLALEGHQADIYEAAPKPGGWLRYGIPEYRLPNDLLDKEISRITELGVRIFCGQKLGDNLKYSTLQNVYDAVILTIGSQKGTKLGVEGDDAQNVFSGIDFLRNMEMTGQRADFRGKRVAVVGGGNTAMDCCRTSIRCGAEKVYVIYRRTEAEMPANPIEIHESKLEGVEYLFLTNPTKVNKDENGVLQSVTCVRMELGEPDASGRRRPVPVEGSETDIVVDYILAAIGQKTDINFLDHVNSTATKGVLKANKWGDLDADAKTLQTGIENMFAAGDGVTGPATIIEAVAQARIAVNSCNLYLEGKAVEPMKKEFISRKENFREINATELTPLFLKQVREEMPVLEAKARLNFNEVELGYSSADIAAKEAARCLECGCGAIYTCDLKRYAGEYGASQKHYSGEFHQKPVDYRHPFIEIDNNKCILCNRCIRICKEVAGVSALGLVNRGFDTIVAPAGGGSLLDTNCDSCGLCLSACPTGALSENVPFKPGPVQLEPKPVIDFLSPEGFEANLMHHKDFYHGVTGRTGIVNQNAHVSRRLKFGYRLLNEMKRITKPLVKRGDKFEEISFNEAIELLVSRFKEANHGKSAFFAGARLTNEELYLVQKLARGGVNTGNIASFHYLGRSTHLKSVGEFNVPFNDLYGVKNFIVLGCELNATYPATGFLVEGARTRNGAHLTNVSTLEESAMAQKASKHIPIKSYYYFVKGLIYAIVSEGRQNEVYLKSVTRGFDHYSTELLKERFEDLAAKAGTTVEQIKEIALNYDKESNSVIIFAEDQVDGNTAQELINLALITGKLGKTMAGLLALRGHANSQGLWDMGIHPEIGVGHQPADNAELLAEARLRWNVKNVAGKGSPILPALESGSLSHFFIAGEDPFGCAYDNKQVEKWFRGKEFMVVMDYFMTETAEQADLILPASFSFEIGGSYTNTQKNIQMITASPESGLEMSSIQQLVALCKAFGMNSGDTVEELFLEMAALLPGKHCQPVEVISTLVPEDRFVFKFNADAMIKAVDNAFIMAFSN